MKVLSRFALLITFVVFTATSFARAVPERPLSSVDQLHNLNGRVKTADNSISIDPRLEPFLETCMDMLEQTREWCLGQFGESYLMQLKNIGSHTLSQNSQWQQKLAKNMNLICRQKAKDRARCSAFAKQIAINFGQHSRVPFANLIRKDESSSGGDASR